MPEKRKRRVASPSRPLPAGEKLDRTRLRQDADVRWSWVGTKVKRDEDITETHCLLAAGLGPTMVKPCPNKYVSKPKSSSPTRSASHASSSQTIGDEDTAVIVISDDEVEACCNKKRCKDNPYCLNYLGQDKWENEDRALRDYLKVNLTDEDPHELAKKFNIPVGLKNLGATCYANAFLQVWFQDLAFRSAVFRCQPSESSSSGKFEESPVFQLQATFASLQESNQYVYNPIKLVESLQLQTSIQQDAQEFSKLFMSHLDNEFKKQSDPQLQSLLQNQFEGKVVHATVCDKCKSRSERESTFLELEVNLENNATLDERIKALLAPERMVEDNQYRCSACDSLQDATRYTELRELPPVLHVSLLRFVYDTTNYERKKSKDKIRFPPCLNMDQFLRSTGPDGRMEVDLTAEQIDNAYELRGVLLHKGQSAYHGHYEAQVFDCTAKKWYQFNDELVSHLDSFATSVTTQKTPVEDDSIVVDDFDADDENSKTKAGKRPRKVAKSRRVMDSDDEQEERVDANNIKSRKFIHSKDAYMLIYARRGHAMSSASSSPDIPSLVNGSGNAKTLPQPPTRAMETVESDNDKFLKDCRNFDQKKDRLEEECAKRRLMVMDIYKSWAVSSQREPCMIASRSSLEKWLGNGLDPPPKSKDNKDTTSSPSKPCDENPKQSTKTLSSDEEFPDFLTLPSKSSPTPSNSSPNAINNYDLLCHHNRLSPMRTKDAKVISMHGYELLKRGGCTLEPELLKTAVCEDCVRAEFREKLYQIEHPRLVTEFNQVCNPEFENTGFYISKAWLKDWLLQKPRMHRSSEDDPAPDSPEYASHVTCEHGGLSLCRSDRRRITPAAVNILKVIFPEWNPVPWSMAECEICQMHLDSSREAKLALRKKAENEKALLLRMQNDHVFGRKALSDERPCAIIPSEFVRAWRSWLSKPGDTPRPESLDNSFLFCKHGNLVVDFNSSDFDDGLAVISRDEWETLTSFYEAGPLITIQNVGPCDGSGDSLSSEPNCCIDCRLSSKLDFDQARLRVILLRPEESIPSSEEGANRPSGSRASNKLPEFLKNGKSGSLAASGERTLPSYGRANGTRQSRRIRDNWNSSHLRHIEVRKTWTLKEVKGSIETEFNIAPYLQKVYYHGKEWKDDKETVATLSIQVGDTLHVKELQVTTCIDLDSETDKPATKKAKRNEGGAFEGTLLGGGSTRKEESSSATAIGEEHKSREASKEPMGINNNGTATSKSCSVCTLENPLASLQCEACYTVFP